MIKRCIAAIWACFLMSLSVNATDWPSPDFDEAKSSRDEAYNYTEAPGTNTVSTKWYAGENYETYLKTPILPTQEVIIIL